MYSLQLATERRQRQCIPDRRRQAVPCTCRSHWEGTVTECWTSGGWYHQHGWVSRAQATSSVDIRCLVQAVNKVHRRCSMKTVVGQNAQPECDSLRNSQPMEFTKQWGYAFWLPRWEKLNGRRHSRQTAAGLAAGRGYQQEPSCSSPPCWQSVHEPRCCAEYQDAGYHTSLQLTYNCRKYWRLHSGSFSETQSVLSVCCELHFVRHFQ